jgi:hypothetical protein
MVEAALRAYELALPAFEDRTAVDAILPVVEVLFLV